MTNSIIQAMDTIARSVWHPLLETMPSKTLAASLLHSRIEMAITDRVIEDDDKGPEVNEAIDSLKDFPGPVLLRHIHLAVDRAMGA